MNSQERALTALRREEPDRVPIIEFVVDPKVWKAAVPAATSMADAMDRLDMDSVSCGVSYPAVEHREDGTYLDEWGVLYKPTAELVAGISSAPATACTRAARRITSWRWSRPRTSSGTIR